MSHSHSNSGGWNCYAGNCDYPTEELPAREWLRRCELCGDDLFTDTALTHVCPGEKEVGEPEYGSGPWWGALLIQLDTAETKSGGLSPVQLSLLLTGLIASALFIFLIVLPPLLPK